MKKQTLLGFLLLVGSLSPLFGQVFELQSTRDNLLFGIGTAFAVATMLLPTNAPTAGPAPDLADVNGLDAALVFPFSGSLGTVSLVLTLLSAATPIVVIPGSGRELLLIDLVMYTEAVSLSFGLKNFLKFLLPRSRPYLYNGTATDEELAQDEGLESFPSGHTTLAFTGAAFASYVFALQNPASQLRIPVIVGSYTLALATAALRVGSGNHFLTDVLAGAALGTASGILIPFLHRVRPSSDEDIAVEAGADGVFLRVAY